MSLVQKKVILIASGIVILLITFFLVFQRNQETVYQLEGESRNYQNRVNHLNNLQRSVNEMQRSSQSKKVDTDAFTGEFLSQVPQQKAIYNLYLMMKKSKIRITAITPGDPQTFFQNGDFVTSDQTSAAATGTAAEQNPEKKVSLDQMIGRYSMYDVQITGTLNQIMKAIDWVDASKEHMTIWAINLSYDSSTGKLSGNINLAFNELNGNGRAYEEPDVSDISLNAESIFKIFGSTKK